MLSWNSSMMGDLYKACRLSPRSACIHGLPLHMESVRGIQGPSSLAHFFQVSTMAASPISPPHSDKCKLLMWTCNHPTSSKMTEQLAWVHKLRMLRCHGRISRVNICHRGAPGQLDLVAYVREPIQKGAHNLSMPHQDMHNRIVGIPTILDQFYRNACDRSVLRHVSADLVNSSTVLNALSGYILTPDWM